MTEGPIVQVAGQRSDAVILVYAADRKVSLLVPRDRDPLADRTVGPIREILHPIDERAAYHNFIGMGYFFRKRTSFDDRNFHQGQKSVADAEMIGDLETGLVRAG